MNLQNATVTGFFSLPSPSLAEANPDAYNNALRECPSGAGSCQYCGMGILHHVVVRLEDGRTAFIGSDCAQKVGEEPVRRAVKARMTTEQMEAQEAMRQARMRQYEDEERRRQLLRSERVRAFASDLESLRWSGNDFYCSLADQLEDGPLSDRQARYAVKAIIGRETKKNADAWWAKYEELTR